MGLSDLLACLVGCVLDNGGGNGGFGPVDKAARRAQKDPRTLTDEDMERLLKTKLGYFYANMPTAFDAVKDDLWSCVKGCIGADDASPPKWFTVETYLTTLVTKAR